MNNTAVMGLLEQMIRALITRLQELVVLQQDPGGPLAEMGDRIARLSERISSINLRIMHLQNRLNERRLAARVAGAVLPVPAARAAAMRRALQKVSASIATAKTFKAAIRLATGISEAASKAHAAAAL